MTEINCNYEMQQFTETLQFPITRLHSIRKLQRHIAAENYKQHKTIRHQNV